MSNAFNLEKQDSVTGCLIYSFEALTSTAALSSNAHSTKRYDPGGLTRAGLEHSATQTSAARHSPWCSKGGTPWAPSIRRPRRSVNQFAQDRHQEPKFTRCGPAFRARSGCIPDNLNQMAHALDKSLANHSMIQIVQYDVQTDLPRLRNRRVVNRSEWRARPDHVGQSSAF